MTLRRERILNSIDIIAYAQRINMQIKHIYQVGKYYCLKTFDLLKNKCIASKPFIQHANKSVD